jgi:oxygen-dependent protoporphyrinogen oxidase
MSEEPAVAIVGGGISGLATAYWLRKRAPRWRYVLYEASERLGGVLRTVRTDGFLIEASADNFLAGGDTAAAQDLAEEIGFREQLIETNPQHRRALVAFRGKLHDVPLGFQLMGATQLRSVLFSTLLSWPARLRLACEPFVRPRTDSQEESLAQFATRRLGKQAYERLVQPLVSGIYSADPTKLSVAAALPRFTKMERESGSIWKGLRDRGRSAREQTSTASGARYGLFLAPRDGMESFATALQNEVLRRSDCGTATAILTKTSVKSIKPSHDRRWQLTFEGRESQVFDGVVLAIPTHQAAALVRFDAEMSDAFNAIEYASVAVACIGFRRQQIEHPLDAFGIVVPKIADRPIIAVSFSSVKFLGRAPDNHVLFRVFVGGACQPALVALDDDHLRKLVCAELADLIGARGQPVHFSVHRWQRSTPQYHIGHGQRIARIERALQAWPGLRVAGNAYRGIGVPQCVASGKKAAAEMVAHLGAD